MHWEFDRVTNSTAHNEPPNTRVQPALLRGATQRALRLNRLVSQDYS
jgi:hypothetical protein